MDTNSKTNEDTLPLSPEEIKAIGEIAIGPSRHEQFLNAHYRKLMWGGITLGIVAGGVIAFFSHRNDMRHEAAAKVVQAMSLTAPGNAIAPASEYDAATSKRRYAVTYFRPVAERMSVAWSDNLGSEGRVERTSQHTQPSYYPLWIPSESFTLYGSLIAPNTTQDAAGNFKNNPYAWGYADNEGSNTLASDAQSCGFDISNAVREDGEPMELGYIDFVKVQSAINHTAGLLGEVSAEVVDIAARRREQ